MFKGLRNIVERRLADKIFIENLVKEPIEDFSCSANSSKDGFMGDIKCIVIKTKAGATYNLIYKGISLASDKTFSFFFYFELCARENLFYTVIAPGMENLCKSSLPIPKMYDCLNDGKTDFLVLEDLRPLGYKMPEKYPSLTFDETKMILQKLGTFNAQGFHYIQEQGKDFFTEDLFVFSKHFYDATSEPSHPHWPNYNRVATDAMKIIKDKISVDLAKKMDDICSRAIDLIVQPWKCSSTGKYFSVICHGDLWSNNVLFKYSSEGKKPLDVKFIDFQQCHVGSIYEDLYYFIFTSTSPEFRKVHLNTLLDIFYEAFTLELRHIGNQQLQYFTREKFNEEFFENVKTALAWVAWAVTFHLGVFPEPDDSSNKEKLEQSGEDDTLKVVPLVETFTEFSAVCPIAFKNSQRAINRLLDVIQEFSDMNVL